MPAGLFTAMTPPAPVENPLKEGEDPFEAVLKPIKRVVLMEPAIETIVLAGLSAYTGRPLNIIILRKKPGQGCSYTLKHTLDVFPPEDVRFLDYDYPSGLFFRDGITGYVDRGTNEDITPKINELKQKIAELEWKKHEKEGCVRLKNSLRELTYNAVAVVNLEHKIIAFIHPSDVELFTMLKPLLSGGREYFDIKFTIRDASGDFKTKNVRIVGRPVFMFVLSEDEVKNSKEGAVIEPQLISRFFRIEINTDPKKFAAGQSLIGARYTNESPFNAEYEAELERAQQYLRYLREQIVALKRKRGSQAITFNPFVEELWKSLKHSTQVKSAG